MSRFDYLRIQDSDLDSSDESVSKALAVSAGSAVPSGSTHRALLQIPGTLSDMAKSTPADVAPPPGPAAAASSEPAVRPLHQSLSLTSDSRKPGREMATFPAGSPNASSRHSAHSASAHASSAAPSSAGEGNPIADAKSSPVVPESKHAASVESSSAFAPPATVGEEEAASTPHHFRPMRPQADTHVEAASSTISADQAHPTTTAETLLPEIVNEPRRQNETGVSAAALTSPSQHPTSSRKSGNGSSAASSFRNATAAGPVATDAMLGDNPDGGSLQHSPGSHELQSPHPAVASAADPSGQPQAEHTVSAAVPAPLPAPKKKALCGCGLFSFCKRKRPADEPARWDEGTAAPAEAEVIRVEAARRESFADEPETGLMSGDATHRSLSIPVASIVVSSPQPATQLSEPSSTPLHDPPEVKAAPPLTPSSPVGEADELPPSGESRNAPFAGAAEKRTDSDSFVSSGHQSSTHKTSSVSSVQRRVGTRKAAPEAEVAATVVPRHSDPTARRGSNSVEGKAGSARKLSQRFSAKKETSGSPAVSTVSSRAPTRSSRSDGGDSGSGSYSYSYSYSYSSQRSTPSGERVSGAASSAEEARKAKVQGTAQRESVRVPSSLSPSRSAQGNSRISKGTFDASSLLLREEEPLPPMPAYQRRVLLDLRARERRDAETAAREWRHLTFRPHINGNPFSNDVEDDPILNGNRRRTAGNGARATSSGSPSCGFSEGTPQDYRLRHLSGRLLAPRRPPPEPARPSFKPEISTYAKTLVNHDGGVFQRLFHPSPKSPPERGEEYSHKPEISDLARQLYPNGRGKLLPQFSDGGDSPRQRESVFDRLYRKRRSPGSTPETSPYRLRPSAKPSFQPQITALARQLEAVNGRKHFSDRLYYIPRPSQQENHAPFSEPSDPDEEFRGDYGVEDVVEDRTGYSSWSSSAGAEYEVKSSLVISQKIECRFSEVDAAVAAV